MYGGVAHSAVCPCFYLVAILDVISSYAVRQRVDWCYSCCYHSVMNGTARRHDHFFSHATFQSVPLIVRGTIGSHGSCSMVLYTTFPFPLLPENHV